MSFSAPEAAYPAPAADAAPRVLELLPEPVLVVEERGPGELEIVYANGAARDLYRIGPDRTPLGSAIRHPRVLQAIDEALAQSQPKEATFESIGAQPRFWRALIRPIENGAPGLVLMLRDETDARRTERMRADFLANASHELRTPLASLAGFVETLQTHAKDDPEARERFLGIMAEQAARMGRLIDDLLSLSRIELSEHVPPAGRVNLARLVGDVVDASRPLIGGRKVAVQVADAEAPGPSVAGDRDQLVQVVQNLLDNALKYSGADAGVILTVDVAPDLETARTPSRADVPSFSLVSPDRENAGGYAVLRVGDQGRGMARRHLPRLTERFYRAGAQSGGGTGLGLAIVKHVVNRHRGGLLVESEEGAGTTLSVYLPAAPD